ncbi:MAG: prolyl oligopeptidase family serine peptidase [Bacteroidales bacterium]
MMKKFIRTPLITCLSVGFITAYSQKTGNIVEIFGKEKVETVAEGKVIHQFREGLVLKKAMRPGLIDGTGDILFWEISSGVFERPQESQVLKDDYAKASKEKPVWQKALADSAGIFQLDLQRGYLYTELESKEVATVLLEATGHTRVYINGMPHEGDHYDYGYTLIPFKLKKGLNQFVYTYGRFPRIRSRIVLPRQPVMFSPRDLTLPSILTDENQTRWAAVRVLNTTEKALENYSLTCKLADGSEATLPMDRIEALTTRKVKFQIPAYKNLHSGEKVEALLVLKNPRGKIVDQLPITLRVHDTRHHHERTFVSLIDGSVQYYSMIPSLSDKPHQAFVLSVHGASVEATNQARAYKQKDWCHIVAPTNRRPFGFNWEEWGRLDALEVMQDAMQRLSIDSSRIYLTGHSMGGHGTWYLGATYPDRWAAIAPCAGYPDIIRYRKTGSDSALMALPHFSMLYRGARAGRTLDLLPNFLQSGVYILHGSADAVVPTEQARNMRQLLGTFHNNFCYYEYPGGTHWYGDHSMDWPPLFDFLRQNRIPKLHEVDSLEFLTASPGVSASDYWVDILQQIHPLELSRIKAVRKSDTIIVSTENIACLRLRISALHFKANPLLLLDGKTLQLTTNDDLIIRLKNNSWEVGEPPLAYEKHPQRYGSFKMAFTNHMVFVYATGGTQEENEWYRNKAVFDAETFLYLGNGSIDIIPDKAYDPSRYAGRNIILYGNADNNRAWDKVLGNCPVRVEKKGIRFGKKYLSGTDLGTMFCYPHSTDPKALVGIVAGTGSKGMQATFSNHYFSGITGFPDLLIFTHDWIKEGPSAIKVSGFFGNDWSVDKGDFVITD